MKAVEWADLIFLRINLAICAVCLAATIAGCANHVLTPSEATVWFAFGLAEETLLHLLPSLKLRLTKTAKKIFSLGITVLLILGGSYFYPDASLLNEACHLAAICAGLALALCVFRKKFVLSVVQKAQELQALRAQGITINASHFRD